ncbi:hypothetical protein ACQRIU_001913 [Beauveria bassiana]
MTPRDSRARHHILPESSAQPMGTGVANTARHRYKKRQGSPQRPDLCCGGCFWFLCRVSSGPYQYGSWIGGYDWGQLSGRHIADVASPS